MLAGQRRLPRGKLSTFRPRCPPPAALRATPVTLSQGCGGGEGANTLQHKEQAHARTRAHAHTHALYKDRQPPTQHTLQGMKPSFSFYRFHHIPAHIPMPQVWIRVSPPPPHPPATHTYTRRARRHHTHLFFSLWRVLIEWKGGGMLSCVKRRWRKFPNEQQKNLLLETRQWRCVWDRFSLEGQWEKKWEKLNDLPPAECWNEGVQLEMLRPGGRLDYWWITTSTGTPVSTCGWRSVFCPNEWQQMSFQNQTVERCVNCTGNGKEQEEYHSRNIYKNYKKGNFIVVYMCFV